MSDMTFVTVDEGSLPSDLTKLRAAMREAAKAAKTAREQFEQNFTARARKNGKLLDSQEFVFAHRFGLAVAIVEKGSRKAKSGKAKVTFSL